MLFKQVLRPAWRAGHSGSSIPHGMTTSEERGPPTHHENEEGYDYPVLVDTPPQSPPGLRRRRSQPQQQQQQQHGQEVSVLRPWSSVWRSCMWRRRWTLLVLMLLLIACVVVGKLFYPRTPVIAYAGRSAMHIELPFRPFRDDMVHVHFTMNLSAHNPNLYDVSFSNTQTKAIAFNGRGLGNATLSETLVLPSRRTTYLVFEIHGTVSLGEGMELAVDCLVNRDVTRVSTTGHVDVHMGSALRMRYPIDPISFDFPCILHGPFGADPWNTLVPHELSIAARRRQVVRQKL